MGAMPSLDPLPPLQPMADAAPVPPPPLAAEPVSDAAALVVLLVDRSVADPADPEQAKTWHDFKNTPTTC